MKKLLGTLTLACFLTAPLASFAQDAMKQDATQNDNKQDTMKNDSMKQN